MLLNHDDCIICIVGLGYVGLPLALEFAKKYKVIGYDQNIARVHDLQAGIDRNSESSFASLTTSSISFDSDPNSIKGANVYIITVPTPVDENNIPDLAILREATRLVGKNLEVGNIVIYESTVYPGVTEDVCVPILGIASDLDFNSEFFVGYSPERINPGDKARKLTDIVKVTSGSSDKASKFVDTLYSSIILAGTYMAPSIKVAEASKVIENVQRDVNIALMNEFSAIFDSLSIDTADVLKAACSKWNFLPFTPGLVGGHCIGVDPFYLIHKANKIGVEADLMKTSRKINENVPAFIIRKLVKLASSRGMILDQAKVLILGCAFKENCPDIRNSKVINLKNQASEWFSSVQIEDDVVSADEVLRDYGININKSEEAFFDIIILAVPHQGIVDKGINSIKSRLAQDGIFFDLKSTFPAIHSDIRL
tara:strand:- start:680 stop:1954 length:1275 start_codon:yes stop_codon:yes gene_type:complete